MSNPKEVSEEEGNDEMDKNAIKGTSNPKEVAEEEGNEEMDKNAIKGTSNPKEVSEQGIDEFGDDEEEDFGGGEMNNDDLGSEDSGDDFGDEDLGSDEDVFDMTSASDEEVLKVFKAMGPEDGIVVKKDGEKIKVDTGEEEFIIDLGSEEEAEPAAPEMGDDMGDEFGGDDLGTDDVGGDDEFGADDGDDAGEEDANPFGDESDDEDSEELAEEKGGVLEIDLDDDDDDCDGELEECDKGKEEDVDEAKRIAGMGKRNANKGGGKPGRGGVDKKLFQAGTKPVNENYKKQYNALKKQNTEYKKALGLFREKLNEVAVFNANLAYATRLFTENTTTKQEKMSILERFDSVSTMNDSKKTYVSLKKELGSKTSVTESVAEKISKSPTSSSSKDMLEESKAFENPQFARIKNLMKKIK